MAQILAHACANPHTTMARINLIPSRTVQIALAAILSGAATMAPAQEKTDGWPLVFSSGDDQVQVFKPQPETFDGTSFTARAAVAVQRKQDASPVFGAVWGNGTLAVDRTSRVGKLTAFKVTDVRFPGITDTAEQLRIKTMLSDGILAHAPPIDLDWMVAALEEEKKSDSSYDNAPPEIIYRNKPSMLLYVDGDPIYEKVKNTANGNSDGVYAANGPAVERVVNTPFFLVRTEGKEYWLYGSGLWYKASDFKGPWKDERRAPEYLERLAAKVDTSFKADKNEKHDIIPDVVVTTKPAVLLDVNGAPQMQPYDNSSLMYVTNTDKDLFMDIPTQEYYFLASGRWYATKDLQNGPWRYVAADALPAEFAKVPEGSAKDGILAHVAGTPAAREAVRDASIPQTAQVNRNSVNLTVNYDGSPQFRTIPGTSITAATNASTTVLLINGVYHVCDNAVWYEGNSPDGPWVVSTSVPAQVNDIPPSDPAYRVRYVYIYDYTPDVVYIGYTPGYLGSYVQSGVVIYGTGYYYNPWRGAYWYPRPYTWGFNMYYNPWYGWGFGGGWGFDWFYPSWNYYGYYRPYAWGWWAPMPTAPPPTAIGTDTETTMATTMEMATTTATARAWRPATPAWAAQAALRPLRAAPTCTTTTACRALRPHRWAGRSPTGRQATRPGARWNATTGNAGPTRSGGITSPTARGTCTAPSKAGRRNCATAAGTRWPGLRTGNLGPGEPAPWTAAEPPNLHGAPAPQIGRTMAAWTATEPRNSSVNPCLPPANPTIPDVTGRPHLSGRPKWSATTTLG